jgi:hypothetical protein
MFLRNISYGPRYLMGASPMPLLVSIDDTDTIESPGTGRLARKIAASLFKNYHVTGITRHQLFVHPSIPYTSHNSCAVIHLGTDRVDADACFNIAREIMLADFIDGSDPGLTVASLTQVNASIVAFGKDAKTMVLTQERARILAKNSGVLLIGLGGTEDGVIGAMAGLGLASTGNDGRFLMKGTVRELTGPRNAGDLLDAGIDEICTIDGRRVTEGIIITEKGKSVKPCPIFGKTVLFVEERDGNFHSVKRD